MAFEKKEFRLLAGPLNYSNPGDKFGSEQRYSLLMQNFRIDGKGRLFCRRGIEQQGSADLSSAINRVMPSGHGVYVGTSGGGLYADDGGNDLGASFDGWPVGFATGGEDYAFFMNRSGPKRRQRGGSLEDWSVPAPTSSIGAVNTGVAGSLTGTYQVYVTFVTAGGGETNPSEGVEVTLTNELVSMTGIPTSPNPAVIMRRVYIGGGTLGAVYLLVEINDNVTTALDVDRTETQLTDLGIIMSTSNDPIPSGRVLAGPYFQRLIVASTELEPNAYWWTETNVFTSLPATNVNYIGGGDTPILAITWHKRQINFYKIDGIWRLQNDPATTGDQEQANASFGCIGPNAVVAAGRYDYFVGPSGVYLFDGDNAHEISQSIRGIFEDDRYIPVTADFSVLPMSSDPGAREKTVISWDGQKVYVSYAEQGYSEPNTVLVYDPDLEEWSGYKVNSDAGIEAYTAMAFDAATDKLLGGGGNGKLYHVNHGADDDGNGIPVGWFSGYEDFGLPDNLKVIDDLQIEGNAQGQNLSIFLWADDGERQFSMGTFNLGGFTRQTFPIRDSSESNDVGVRCRNIAVHIDGPEVSSLQGVEITSVILHYRVEVREGRTFDTGPIDLDTWQVKSIREFEMEIESTTNITWTLYTDVPHRALTLRDTGTINHTSGVRGSRFLKLATPPDGSRMRLTLESEQPFKLFTLWVRFLPYGEYVSGAAGDDYESEVLGAA